MNEVSRESIQRSLVAVDSEVVQGIRSVSAPLFQEQKLVATIALVAASGAIRDDRPARTRWAGLRRFAVTPGASAAVSATHPSQWTEVVVGDEPVALGGVDNERLQGVECFGGLQSLADDAALEANCARCIPGIEVAGPAWHTSFTSSITNCNATGTLRDSTSAGHAAPADETPYLTLQDPGKLLERHVVAFCRPGHQQRADRVLARACGPAREVSTGHAKAPPAIGGCAGRFGLDSRRTALPGGTLCQAVGGPLAPKRQRHVGRAGRDLVGDRTAGSCAEALPLQWAGQLRSHRHSSRDSHRRAPELRGRQPEDKVPRAAAVQVALHQRVRHDRTEPHYSTEQDRVHSQGCPVANDDRSSRLSKRSTG